MTPWMSTIAIIWLSVAAICCAIIIVDLINGHRQHMWVMNIVWPTTALYAGPFGLWLYFRIGRKMSHSAMSGPETNKHHHTNNPMWLTVAAATTHCGSGCTLGDILVEGLLILFPLTLFGRNIFAAWAVDYVAAFILGVGFQYFTITPMKKLSPREGLIAALKADSLSLTAWQIGMYGWMALLTFVFLGHELEKTRPEFWFMMQIAMMIGFLTSYPVNWWLVRKGIKEKM